MPDKPITKRATEEQLDRFLELIMAGRTDEEALAELCSLRYGRSQPSSLSVEQAEELLQAFARRNPA